MGRYIEYDWQSVDWSMTNQQIASLANRNIVTVKRARGKYARHTIKPNRNPVTPLAWGWVDWSLKTSVIAKSMGVSLSSVSNARRKYVQI